jgi:hypothetical protein
VQVGAHVPPEHPGTAPVTVVVQTVPHAPQLWTSVFGSMHVPEQGMSPVVAQVTSHDPLLHFAVAPAVVVEHAAPHLPQLLRLDCRSAHALPQAVVPVGHVLTQEKGDAPASPSAQRVPPAQLVPHAPQLAATERSVAQTPPPASPASPASPAPAPASPQSPYPVAQV